jgi:two-component system response regulator RegA
LVKPTDVDHVLAALRPPAAGTSERAVPPDHLSQPLSLGRLEWEHVQRVMSECGGNISRAARALGMHRRTLQRKLNKYPPKR